MSDVAAAAVPQTTADPAADPAADGAPTPPSVLDELRWRGLVALTTDEDALARALADGPDHRLLRFDPTAPSLHFGNWCS